jgi:asparagine synthase (glutamine-hydrolysing)
MTGRRPGRVKLQGWIEKNGKKLGLTEIERIIAEDPGGVTDLGGEFHLSWDGCTATDRLGILGIPGPAGRPGSEGTPGPKEPGLSRGAGAPRDLDGAAPGGWGPSGRSRDRPGEEEARSSTGSEGTGAVPGGGGPSGQGIGAPLDRVPDLFGVITCDGKAVGEVNPDTPLLSLEAAIRAAVRLRADEGAVALSGGIDSALIACLAGLPCVTIGIEGSHDLERGRDAARVIGLPWEGVTITNDDVEEALLPVIGAIPRVAPLDVSIATGLFFVARWARERGHHRILVGQGADELFGGYARYRTATDIPGILARDFASLRGQALRDQAVARLHGTAFSLPYLDLRVVRAARAIPPNRLVSQGEGKIPLRELGARLLPPGMARAAKKAMQYGTGVAGAIRRLARKNGYRSPGEYITHLRV